MNLSRNKNNPRSQPSSSQGCVEGIRPPARKMSDTELLRFGIVAKYMCSREANLEAEQKEAFALRLNEARKEWNRRFPALPLSATFESDEDERPSAWPA
jgi:hypothetical protein